MVTGSYLLVTSRQATTTGSCRLVCLLLGPWQKAVVPWAVHEICLYLYRVTRKWKVHAVVGSRPSHSIVTLFTEVCLSPRTTICTGQRAVTLCGWKAWQKVYCWQASSLSSAGCLPRNRIISGPNVHIKYRSTLQDGDKYNQQTW